MKIRAVKLDVDRAISGPSIVDVAEASDAVGAELVVVEAECNLQVAGSISLGSQN